MRICKLAGRAALALALALALPLASRAQESSLNTYSPYTLYGLGNLNHSSGSSFVGLGGASIGFRNVMPADGSFDNLGSIRLNNSNPASLSALTPASFIIDVGLAGSNVYLNQRTRLGLLKSSFNTFNFNNVTVAFPLAKRLGFSLNVSPYSDVGYRIHTDDTSYLADLGVVRYYYNGEGDVNEAKASVGWTPFRNLSVGAELIYMWGDINRTYQAVILDYTGSGSYSEISSKEGSLASTGEKVSRMFGAFGVQYTPLSKAKSRLTLGATYRLGGRLNSTVTEYIPSNNIYKDTVRFNEMRSLTHMPQRIGAGVYFYRPKWSVGADYIYQDWARHNAYDAANDVEYVNTHTYKIGAQYTPDRMDIRGRVSSFFNRITYKAGFRAGSHYMRFAGRTLNEKAVTLGLDIPFKVANVSMVSLGLELGERGTLNQGLVKERFFKVNVGVMLFGRDYDYWFEKYKYY